jgi:hypothetical protein
MWLIKKQKVKNRQAVSGTDTAARKMARTIENLQRLFARKMNKLFSMMSVKKAKRVLFLFTVLCGGYSLYLIYGALTEPKTKNMVPIEQISPPQHLHKTGAEGTEGNGVEEKTFQDILVYKVFLDSVKNNNPSLYDRMMAEHPGLLDSMRLLEQLYYSQKQNSVYEK